MTGVQTCALPILEENIGKIKDIEDLIKAYNESNDKFTDMNNFYLSTVNDTEYAWDFINYLETIMPKDMRISSMGISNGVASINGACMYKPEVAAFVENLEKHNNIVSVVVTSVTENAENMVNFSCKVTFMTDVNMEAAEAESETTLKEED